MACMQVHMPPGMIALGGKAPHASYIFGTRRVSEANRAGRSRGGEGENSNRLPSRSEYVDKSVS
eukprot:1145254-Pelagomonas_calceolata.AAC.2